MIAETSSLPSPDATLHLRTWRPDGAPRGAVVISHGMAEHGGRYARLAEALTGAGWLVTAHDHRGHGQSTTDATRGHFVDADGWRLVVDDVAAVIGRVRSELGGAPVALLGHSMGAAIATTVAWRHPGILDALVLSGPAGVVPEPLRLGGLLAARVERRRLGARGLSKVLDRLSFGDFNRPFEPARTPFDWLSRDPVEVDAYLADPHCGHLVSTQLWVDQLTAMGHNASVTRLAAMPSTLPVYVFAGDADPVGRQGRNLHALVRKLTAAGLVDVSLRLWPAGRHELLNDTCRDEVTAALLGWLDRKLPR